MIKTNNTPVQADVVYNASNKPSQDIITALSDSANSTDYGTCVYCRRKAIGPHGYCANHI